MGMYDVESSKTAKLKAYDVENGKLSKLKKCYVVNADRKLETLWSGFEPKFITATHSKLYKSVDGASWTVEDFACGVTAATSDDTIGMTYGLGKYWLVNGKYICSSEDGEAWTIEKESVATTGITNSTSFRSVFFVNGQIVVWSRTDKKLHVTSDGSTWSTITPSVSGDVMQLIHGTFKGEKLYFWWIASSSTSGKLYQSSTLDGTLTLVGNHYSVSNNAYDGRIALNNGYLFTYGYSSNSFYAYYESDSVYRRTFSSGDQFMIGSSKSEVVTIQQNGTVKYADVSTPNVELTVQSCSGVGTSQWPRKMNPPYNEEETIAFVLQNNGYYKKKGSTAFTKIANVGTEGNRYYAAAYGTDGGGFYTD